MNKLEWLNEQEKRYAALLEQSKERMDFFQNELSMVRSLKNDIQGDTTEADRPED